MFIDQRLYCSCSLLVRHFVCGGLVGRASGKSAYKNRRDPLGARIAELDIRSHPHFVGRTWELAGLGAHFIGYQKSATVQPVALIQGIGGMGKTSLAAEALDLWSTQFDWVLTFQAKPNALNLDNTLREIHDLLWAELKTYHAHVQENPADAIWRAAKHTSRMRFATLAALTRVFRFTNKPQLRRRRSRVVKRVTFSPSMRSSPPPAVATKSPPSRTV